MLVSLNFIVFFASMFYVLLKTCDFYFKLGILHEFE